MKIQTFNRQLIRQYMLTSPILEDGIQYCQYITPGASREAAKESAIRLAEEYCERKWYNDSTGYIRNEFIALLAFFGSPVMWVFTSIGSWLVWLPILIVSIIVFDVTVSKIDPKLPNDFFKKIKNGTYHFDA